MLVSKALYSGTERQPPRSNVQQWGAQLIVHLVVFIALLNLYVCTCDTLYTQQSNASTYLFKKCYRIKPITNNIW